MHITAELSLRENFTVIISLIGITKYTNNSALWKISLFSLDLCKIDLFWKWHILNLICTFSWKVYTEKINNICVMQETKCYCKHIIMCTWIFLVVPIKTKVQHVMAKKVVQLSIEFRLLFQAPFLFYFLANLYQSSNCIFFCMFSLQLT